MDRITGAFLGVVVAFLVSLLVLMIGTAIANLFILEPGNIRDAVIYHTRAASIWALITILLLIIGGVIGWCLGERIGDKIS